MPLCQGGRRFGLCASIEARVRSGRTVVDLQFFDDLSGLWQVGAAMLVETG